MTIDVDVLGEVYTIMKQYISSKDRQEVADNLMSVLVDMLDDKELKEFGGIDSSLGRALKEYVDDSDDSDDNDYY